MKWNEKENWICTVAQGVCEHLVVQNTLLEIFLGHPKVDKESNYEKWKKMQRG